MKNPLKNRVFVRAVVLLGVAVGGSSLVLVEPLTQMICAVSGCL